MTTLNPLGEFLRSIHLARVPELGDQCPRCGNGPVVPIVYGMPSDPYDDGQDAIMGGCVVCDEDRGCTECDATWQGTERGDSSATRSSRLSPIQIDDVGEPEIVDISELPDDLGELAVYVVDEAVGIEHRAHALDGLAVLAAGLRGALERADWPVGSREPAESFIDLVDAAASRAHEIEGMARRVLDRVTALMRSTDMETIDEEAYTDLYERVLTTRLHLPIAADLLGDAEVDGGTGLRYLARIAAGAAALADPGEQADALAWAARGALALHTSWGGWPLDDEEPHLWSPTLDTLTLELAGLIAHMVLAHSVFIIAAVGEEDGRYIQCLTYESGMLCESVGDQFCKVPLTDDDRQALVALGWSPPDPTEEHLVNWTRRFDEPVDAAEVATLLFRTLVEVHGLEHPTDIVLEVSESD